MNNIDNITLEKSMVVNSKTLTIILGLILACIPFIQLGYQYYFSFMILTFFLLSTVPNIRDLSSQLLILLSVLILMLMPGVFYMTSEYANHNILRAGREFLCFSIIFVFISRSRYIVERVQPNIEVIKVIIIILIIGLLCFTIVQYVFLMRGIGMFLPVDYYIKNYGTIPTALDLKWSRIRPSASFGEPSYLGFIVFSLLFTVLHIFDRKNVKITLTACVLVTVVLANTLAGIIACSILIWYYLWRRNRQVGFRSLLIAFSVSLAFLVVFSGYLNISDRIANIGDKKAESSGYARIVVPLKVVSKIMATSPIGMPNNELPSLFRENNYSTSEYLGGPLSNGFFNIIINYGVFGFFIMFLIYRATRGDWLIVMYLFLASMFNGGIFTFDKASIIGLTILLITYGNNIAANRSNKSTSNHISNRNRQIKKTTILSRRSTL